MNSYTRKILIILGVILLFFVLLSILIFFFTEPWKIMFSVLKGIGIGFLLSLLTLMSPEEKRERVLTYRVDRFTGARKLIDVGPWKYVSSIGESGCSTFFAVPVAGAVIALLIVFFIFLFRDFSFLSYSVSGILGLKFRNELKIDYESDKIAASNLYIINRGNSGFADKEGNVVIEPRFSEVRNFSEGLACVNIMGKFGYIDTTGRIVIKPKFDQASDFSEGIATVVIDEYLFFINRKGKYLARGIFVKAFHHYTKYNPWAEIASILWDDDKDKRKKEPKVITNARYLLAGSSFQNGLIPFRRDEIYGYLDRHGRVAIEEKFSQADEFSEGRAAICLEEKYGFVDSEGNISTSNQYSAVFNYSEGLARIDAAQGFREYLYGFIDKEDSLVIRPEYIDAGDFSEGYAAVKTEVLSEKGDPEKFGYIDKTGTMRIRPQYDEAYPFKGGLARVRIGEKFGYIDKNGRYIVPPELESAEDFYHGMALVCPDSCFRYNSRYYMNPEGDLVFKLVD